MTPLVITEHLTKSYGRRRAVDDLTLSVDEGTVAVLLGPNGAGKSTALEMLATLRLPTAGRAEVAGLDVVRQQTQVRRLLGHVPQTNALDPSMSVAESVAFQLRAAGAGRRQERAAEVVELMNLTSHLTSRVGTLSGGTRRRVDLALALVGSPRLLVLDEPTTGLDPTSRLDLWGELRAPVGSEGVTVVMSTQDLHEADVLASELFVLRDGALVARGSPAALKRSTGERTLTVEGHSPASAAVIVEHLDGRCHRTGPTTAQVPLDGNAGTSWVALLAPLATVADEIASLSVHEPTLDDVFAALTDSTTEVCA